MLIIQLFSYKVCALSLALIGFILNYSYLNFLAKILFFCGFIVYLVPLTIIILCIFNPNFVKKLVDGFVNVMEKIGIKRFTNNKDKINDAINQYNECSIYFKNHKVVFLKSIVITLIGVMCCYLVSYFVLLSLGFNDLNIMTVFWRQSILYAMASWFPLPGAVGASELTYLNLFSFINNQDSLVSALILYRGITFYFYIIVGLIVYLRFFIKYLKK